LENQLSTIGPPYQKQLTEIFNVSDCTEFLNSDLTVAKLALHRQTPFLKSKFQVDFCVLRAFSTGKK